MDLWRAGPTAGNARTHRACADVWRGQPDAIAARPRRRNRRRVRWYVRGLRACRAARGQPLRRRPDPRYARGRIAVSAYASQAVMTTASRAPSLDHKLHRARCRVDAYDMRPRRAVRRAGILSAAAEAKPGTCMRSAIADLRLPTVKEGSSSKRLRSPLQPCCNGTLPLQQSRPSSISGARHICLSPLLIVISTSIVYAHTPAVELL